MKRSALALTTGSIADTALSVESYAPSRLACHASHGLAALVGMVRTVIRLAAYRLTHMYRHVPRIKLKYVSQLLVLIQLNSYMSQP